MEKPYDKIYTEKDESEVGEKHVPVVNIQERIIEVKIGEVEHPSEPGHFIQWIELLDGEISMGRIYLSPFTKPAATFNIKEKLENPKIRIFCNLHGTWQKEL